MRRAAGIRAAAAVVAVSAALAAPARAAVPGVSVDADRTSVATQLGRDFGFRSTIANTGARATPRLIAHLNVLSLRNGTYVDPEDWSSRRTVYLGSLAPGESRTVRWKMKAVNDGSFATYVAVLPQTGPTVSPSTGPSIEVDVTKRSTINSGGILPIALGVPLVLGAITAGARLARRR